MTNIYEELDRRTAGVSAYAILENGEPVGKVVLLHPRNSQRLTAYLHLYGLQMVKGTADGGGYDKASAAMYVAANKLPSVLKEWSEELPHFGATDTKRNYKLRRRAEWVTAHIKDDGQHWDDALRDGGFTVQQVL